MVTIGFIVEGFTEKISIESKNFEIWAKQQGIIICTVINAEGSGELLPKNIEKSVNTLILEKTDCIVILTDLENELNPQVVKDRIGSQYTKFIFIAVKAIEAWFLADNIALSDWLKTSVFEEYPEETQAMPWERLRELANEHKQRGTGASKVVFAKKFMEKNGFDFVRAANHPHCPSAKEFHDGLIALAIRLT